MPKYKHGSGSIYKRGQTWWIAYYDHGKQVCESAKTKNKAEARTKLNERLGEIAKGEFIGPAAEKVTFEELAELIQTDAQGIVSQRLVLYQSELLETID